MEFLSNHVSLIIDTSGSMGSSASNMDESREYSRLDFAKQCAIFTTMALSDDMIFSIVTFSNYATTLVAPTKLNENNREAIIQTIKQIRSGGGTNIMTALVECNKLIECSEAKTNVILLSDGEDSKLNQNNFDQIFMETFGEAKYSMDTVGYGPSANTKLLVKMATMCSGTYALCYDASMVGTIFGRAIVRTYMNNQVFGIEEEQIVHSDEYTTSKNDFHMFRILLHDILLNDYRFRQDAQTAINAFEEQLRLYIRSYSIDETFQPDWFGFLCLMHADTVDQLTMAVDNDSYYSQWGKAYWTTMGISFEKQYAPNFKDKSLQCFGTEVAKDEYQRLSTIYDGLEMVKPSLSRGPPSIVPTYSRTFNNANGVCFHGKSTMTTVNDEIVTLDDIVRGLNNSEDVTVYAFKSPDFTRFMLVTIERVIITPIKEKMFCIINDCILTPNHPISYDGKWTHPCKIVEPVLMADTDCMFNIILKKQDGVRPSHIIVDDYPCVTLGHGIQDNSDAQDPFWGTEKVIECFDKAFPNQTVIRTQMTNIRDPNTQMTVDLEFYNDDNNEHDGDSDDVDFLNCNIL